MLYTHPNCCRGIYKAFFLKAQLTHFFKKKAQLTNAVILAYNPYAQLTTGLQEYAYQEALNAEMLSFTLS